MKRRALLAATAVAAAGPLAGCLDGDAGPAEDDATDGPDPTETATRTEDASSTDDADVTPGDESGTAELDGDGPTETKAEAETESPTESGSPTETDEGTPTETREDGPSGDEGGPTETATETAALNRITDRSFEVQNVECGSGEHRATVERADDRVDVDGTIRGRSGCYTAELERAEYDDGADELTVAVHAYEDADEEGCAQCIVDVDYLATVEFEDGTPDEVYVYHDGERVTTG